MTDYSTRQTLIQRVRNQYDDASWEEFVSFYQRYIYAIVRNMNIAHHDTEDMVQQVLLKVWKGIQKFNYQPGKHRFRSWLSTVTKNTVINYIQLKSNQILKLSGSEKGEMELYLNSISLPDIDKIVTEEWQHYIATLAMERVEKRLSRNAIDAFKLFTEGLSGNAVADQLGIPVNTAHVYKKRVQEALRQEIKNLDLDLG